MMHRQFILNLTFKRSFGSSQVVFPLETSIPRKQILMSFYLVIHIKGVQYIGMLSGGNLRI